MKDNFLKGIFKENPIFVSLLALCPALAVTTSMEAALGMGILLIITLVVTNSVISLIAPYTPKEIKTPVFITLIAAFVVVIRMLTEAFMFELSQSLGVFISLIVTNCVVLGRAESFASKNKILPAIVDGLGMGVGMTLALVSIGLFREFFGTGGFSFGDTLTFIPNFGFHPLEYFAIPLFTQAAGAFLSIGILLAIIAYAQNVKTDQKKGAK